MHTIFSAKIPFSTAVLAADVKRDTLQNWAKKTDFLVGEMTPQNSGKSGRERTFSFFGVVQIAVTAAINKHISSVERAARASAAISHFGDSSAQWVNDPNPPNSAERLPGLPFQCGQTFLIVHEDVQQVLNMEISDTMGDLLGQLPHHGESGPFTIVPFNPIFNRVAVVLGYQPQPLLDEIYAASASNGGGKS